MATHSESKTTNIIDQMAEAQLGKKVWAKMRRDHRANPKNRWVYEMIEEQEWDRIEKIRLDRRPWWKKLLRITQ